METGISLAPPVKSGERVFYPLIRFRFSGSRAGCMADACPIALLFSEENRWFFIALEEGITQDILQQVIAE